MTQIDNGKQVKKINTVFSGIIIILLMILGAYYVFDIAIVNSDLIMPVWTVLGLLLIAYRFGGFEYISIEFTDDNIDIKYYRLFPFDRTFNRIVIPNDMFGDFKVQKGIGGLFSYLILYQNRGGAMAQYPPIGLSATTHAFRTSMLKSLNDLKGI